MKSLRRIVAVLLVTVVVVGAFTSCDLFHEHSFGEWVVTTEPTCTATGVKTKTCECGETETEEIAMIAHAWVDATCTSPKTCSACKATEGEALGHTWADATCTAPKTCSVCKLTEGENIDHSFDEGVCTMCEYEDPIYKERKIGESVFRDLISIGATAEKIGNYVSSAWYFYIYESDDMSALSDGMSEFASETGLSKKYVEQATVEYLKWLGIVSDGEEVDYLWKHTTVSTLDGCIFVAVRACELSGLTEGKESQLAEIKDILSSMSSEYEKETGLSILTDMYSKVSRYYSLVIDPSGNYNDFKNKVSNYTDKILDDIDELNFIYE